jgi:hypothetical protein
MDGMKILYYISTGLLTVLMLFSAGMYIFNHLEIVKAFEHLGHPAHVIYPLAIAKILGLFAIWTNYSKSLKEWAYAGFFFDFVLAWMAHYFAGDGAIGLALPAIIIVLVSYFSDKQLAENN